MLASGIPGQVRFTHSSSGGFCTVCGTVWPCPQSGRQDDDGSGHP